MEIAAQCRESALAWANEIDTRLQAADELERLERVNTELVTAMRVIASFPITDARNMDAENMSALARAALTSATKEQQK